MITELKPEQKARFQEFIDKWTAIGLSTEPANRKEAEEGVIEAYKIVGLKAPKIVWCGSPMSQGLTRAIVLGLKNSEVMVGKNKRDSVRDSVRASVEASVMASVRASVRASVGASVRASVWDSVRDSVGDSVRASVGASVEASVWASVGASVRASVWDSVRDSVGDSVWDSVRASVWDSGYGQHDASWLGFYEYFKLVCNLGEETEKLTGLWKISKNAGWWLPHDKICWISERHSILKRNNDGRLHCENGMAVMYPDGWGIYALNGTRVPEYLVMTPAGKLDIEFFKKEQNADIKAEFIRKYGIERMKGLGKLVDSWKNYDDEWFEKSEYELIDMAPIFTTHKYAPFLLMKNQTTGTYHMEGVKPDCKTLKDALKFRYNNRNAKLVGIK